MAYRVAWSPRAVEDLEAIAQYIAVDSNAYAAAVVTTILRTASPPIAISLLRTDRTGVSGSEYSRVVRLQLSDNLSNLKTRL